MPDGGYCRCVVDVCVLIRESVIEQPAQSVVSIFIVIVIEIIPAHLVDNEPDNEFRPLYLCAGSCCHQQSGYEEKQFFHFR